VYVCRWKCTTISWSIRWATWSTRTVVTAWRPGLTRAAGRLATPTTTTR